jgi:hypothetical protein
MKLGAIPMQVMSECKYVKREKSACFSFSFFCSSAKN